MLLSHCSCGRIFIHTLTLHVVQEKDLGTQIIAGVVWQVIQSFESFHHGKWTLLLAIRVTFFAFCVGSGGWICVFNASD